MNRTISEGSLPSEWKHAIVTPVYKSGPRTDPTNYRPISILPVLSKILERRTSNGVYLSSRPQATVAVSVWLSSTAYHLETSLVNVTNALLRNTYNGLLTGLVF